MKLTCVCILFTALLLTGCAQEQAAEPTEEEKTQDEITEQAMEEAPRGKEGEPGRQVQDMPEDGQLTPSEECQVDKAVQDVGEDGVAQLLQEWVLASLNSASPDDNLPEAIGSVGEARDLSSFLEEKGYVC